MEDILSCKSSEDSMSTSGEFEIVASSGGGGGVLAGTSSATAAVKDSDGRKSVGSLLLSTANPQQPSANDSDGATVLLATSPPTLKIANNGDMTDLEQNLKEIIREIEKSPIESDSSTAVGKEIIITPVLD